MRRARRSLRRGALTARIRSQSNLIWTIGLNRPGAGNGAILNVNGVNIQLIGGRIIDRVVQIGSFVGVP